jgi:hypothetical protein
MKRYILYEQNEIRGEFRPMIYEIGTGAEDENN